VPYLIMHYYFYKNKFERALVALDLGTKNPRKRLGLVVRLSTLVDQGEKITYIFSLCFSVFNISSW
jgi:hypothetical protein